MKKILLLAILLIIFSNRVQARQFIDSYENAKKLAIATNKFILVDFWATWCGPCKRMDAESWSDSEVIKVMNNYVPLKIDIDRERTLANKYGIRSIPDVFIIDPNGEIVYEQKSYMNKNGVLKLLNKFSYKIPLLQDEFSEYLNNANGDTSLKIAEKYIDFSLFVNDDVKPNFLRVANKYLKTTTKHYRKEKQKKKNKQRISIIEDVYIEALKGNYEKSLVELNEYDLAEIEKNNKELFVFLNFALNNKLKNNKKAEFWFKELKLLSNYKLLLAKSRKV